jgi:hypothetical protein
VIVSDIQRKGADSGNELPSRLREIGVTTPVLFYVGEVDRERGRPAGSHSIHDNPATLVRDTLSLLTQSVRK